MAVRRVYPLGTIDYAFVGMSTYAVVTAAAMNRRQTTDQAIAYLSFIEGDLPIVMGCGYPAAACS